MDFAHTVPPLVHRTTREQSLVKDMSRRAWAGGCDGRLFHPAEALGFVRLGIDLGDRLALARGTGSLDRSGDLGRGSLHGSVLCTMEQRVIHEHKRHHRLSNRRGADADTGIMAPIGFNGHRITLLINGTA